MHRRLAIVFLFTAGATASFPHGSFAQTCPANIPHITGTWVTLPYQMPINPISATLLHTGQVLIVAGSENDANNNSTGAESYRAAVWDPTGTTAEQHRRPEHRPTTSSAAARRRCPTGARSSSAAPRTTPSRARTARRSSIPRPRASSSRRAWPTAAGTRPPPRSATAASWRSPGSTLDGRHQQHGRDLRPRRTPGRAGASPTTAPFTPPLYPAHVAAAERQGLLHRAGSGGVERERRGSSIRSRRTWTTSAADDDATGPTARPSSCRCCRRRYMPKVMNFGGGDPGHRIDRDHRSVGRVAGLDAGPQHVGRPHPDERGHPARTARCSPQGGSVNNEIPDTPGKTADLYDPVANTFGLGAARPRTRASTTRSALLLPDATVASIGSNPGDRGSYEPRDRDLHAALPLRRERPADHHRSPEHHRRHAASGAIGYGAPFSVDLHERVADRLGRAGAPGLGDPRLRHGAAAGRPVRCRRRSPPARARARSA